MASDGGFERVLVEFDWYDGPRSGIALVDGVPSYFRTEDFVESPEEATYLTWPVDPTRLPLEVESWRIFVDWNDRLRAGAADAGSHPGHGGIDARYDELEKTLAADRIPPATADARRASWRAQKPGDGRGYSADGPSYEVLWRPGPGAGEGTPC